MGHLREPLQSVEKLRPFALERSQLLLPCWSQPIAAAAAAVGAGFPSAANPALLLHAVKHRVERRQREAQGAVGLLLDAPRQLIAMQRAFLQNAEHRQLRGASLDSRTNHSLPPYRSEERRVGKECRTCGSR